MYSLDSEHHYIYTKVIYVLGVKVKQKGSTTPNPVRNNQVLVLRELYISKVLGFAMQEQGMLFVWGFFSVYTASLAL